MKKLTILLIGMVGLFLIPLQTDAQTVEEIEPVFFEDFNAEELPEGW